MRGNRNKPKVVVVVGATGSGKTDLGLHLAREFDGEIIAADSRTVYRGMDIGTAKPARDKRQETGYRRQETRNKKRGRGDRGRETGGVGGGYLVGGIPHHLIDIRDPDESYSVAEFQRDATRIIGEIVGRGKLPIVVGGTMLYVKTLVDQLEIPEVAADAKLRQELEQKTLEELQAMLEALDPVSAAVIDRHNPRRLIRALEVSRAAGKPFSEVRQRRASPFEFLEIGIDVDRAELYQRIDERTRRMVGGGLVAEVERLIAMYGLDIEPLRGLIYRQVVSWLRTDVAARESIEELIVHLRAAQHRYARSQIRWFHRDASVQWIRSGAQAIVLARQFLAT